MIQEPISTEETWLQGIPVSPGIALGKIKIQISGSKEPVAYDISPEEVDAELVRFHRALQTTAEVSHSDKTGYITRRTVLFRAVRRFIFYRLLP